MTPNPLSAERMREIRDGILGVSRTEITYRPGAEHLPEPTIDSPVVIVVGGGMMQWESFVQARLLGFRVAMTDRSPECFMANHADIFEPIDVFDADGHVALVGALRSQGYHVAGIFVGGIDAEVTAAAVAEKCGLPGNSVAAALMCRDKGLMRAAFDGHTEPVGTRIEWQHAESVEDIRPYTWMAMGRCGRLIVKPLRQSASRGITIVERPDKLQAAIETAVGAGQGGERDALVEACVETPFQFSVEIACIEGEWVGLNVVDRHFDGRYPLVEVGHVNPSLLPAAERDSLFDLARTAAAAVGVTHGVFKIDVAGDTWGNEYVLECTARLSGGFDSQITTPLTGRNFVALGIAMATGRAVDPGWYGRPKGHAVCLAAFPPAGTITGGLSTHDAPRIDFFTQSKYHDPDTRGADVIRFGVGDTIPPYTDCGGRPAFAIRHGDLSRGYDSETYNVWNVTVDAANELARYFQIEHPDTDHLPMLVKDLVP